MTGIRQILLEETENPRRPGRLVLEEARGPGGPVQGERHPPGTAAAGLAAPTDPPGGGQGIFLACIEGNFG